MDDPTSPYRESSPTDIPDRVSKLEKDVKAIKSGFREGLWSGWKGLGQVLCTLAVITAILGVGYFVGTRTVFRGSAWGEAARRNSEREALRWGRVQWPSLQALDVYCTPDGRPGPNNDENCYVTDPSRVIWRIVCDDDNPVTNDGCNASSVKRMDVLPASPGAVMTPIPPTR